MALFDRETDAAKELAGVPLDFGDHRVTLRRQGGANASAYDTELDKAIRPFRAALRAGVFPKQREEEIVFRVFARKIVTRWETLRSSLGKLGAGEADGFVDGIDMRGKLVPFSEDTVVAVYQALPSLYLDHREAAKGEQLFRLERQEDDQKN